MIAYIVYRHPLLGNFRSLTVDKAELPRYQPCIEYEDPSNAEWAAKHLNGECGKLKNECPICQEDRRRELAEKAVREAQREGQQDVGAGEAPHPDRW